MESLITQSGEQRIGCTPSHILCSHERAHLCCRYPGLSAKSTRREVQQRLHDTQPVSKCPDAAGRASPALPTFVEALGLNKTQAAAYRAARQASSDVLASAIFKNLDADGKRKRRVDLAAATARTLKRILTWSQWQIFANRSAALRRPPAVHVAADLVEREIHGGSRVLGPLPTAINSTGMSVTRPVRNRTRHGIHRKLAG